MTTPAPEPTPLPHVIHLTLTRDEAHFLSWVIQYFTACTHRDTSEMLAAMIACMIDAHKIDVAALGNRINTLAEAAFNATILTPEDEARIARGLGL